MNDPLTAGGTSPSGQPLLSPTDATPAWIPPPASPPPPPASVGGPRRRRKRVRVGAAIAGALIAGLAIGVPVGLLSRAATPGHSSSPPSGGGAATATLAHALYLKSLAATRTSVGFHYVAHTSGGNGTQTITGDAGQSSGRQVITFAAPIGREAFTLILVSETVYFQGNLPALIDQLGVPAASAPTLVGKWVSVSSQDDPYSVVAPGITVADQAQETALLPTSTTPTTAAGGVSATRILGTVPALQGAPPGTGYLDVTTSSHLPLSYVAKVSVAGGTATSTTTFSGWGTAPAETAPSGPVAWSTLGAVAPPGGYGSGGANPTPSAGT